MPHHKTPLYLALLLLTLACMLLPGASRDDEPTATPDAAATARTVPPTIGVVSLTPIDLHVGRGMRGPWFELYFTDPANPSGLQHTGGLDERLVEAVDAARLSIHVAIYSLSLNNLRAALIRAHRRGVDVKLVTESDNLGGDDLQRLIDAGIPVLGDRRESTMHDKFMLVDGLEVWTGSMNYTGSGVYADNNCLVRIFSDQLVQAYEAEFSEMFDADSFGPPEVVSAIFPAIELQGTSIEVLFAPDDRPEAALVNLLDTAQRSIDFLAFSFTSDPLSGALLRANGAGVGIRGVMDEEQVSSNIGSEWGPFRSAGVDVRLDGNPGQMHEKVLIVDDEVVVMGSYNFSRGANESNDENLLVIHSRLIARVFTEEFARVYAEGRP